MSVTNKRDFKRDVNIPRMIVEQQNAKAYKKVFQ
jgi:hypothetical protein